MQYPEYDKELLSSRSNKLVALLDLKSSGLKSRRLKVIEKPLA